MRRECIRCNSRQQAGTLDGFGTIAHQRLRPNERPKIPIAGGNKYLKIRPKQGSRLSNVTKNLQWKEPCAAMVNHESAAHIVPAFLFQMTLKIVNRYRRVMGFD